MVLLMWIIGHRLAVDQVNRLLSTAVGDALSISSVTLQDELHRLESVKRVIESLSQMIKTKLPLPPGKISFIPSAISTD